MLRRKAGSVRRVRLVHWNAAEAALKARALRALGYAVDAGPLVPAELRRVKTFRADVIVIDLSRLPSQGRDAALFLRQTKATRQIPLVFVDGDPPKVAGIRSVLPDAAYASWSRIRTVLRRSISRPPERPVVPGVFAGYSGVPLPKKLGIKAGSVVGLVQAPPEFEQTLGPLPEGATLRRGLRGSRDLTLWFTRSRRDLERGMKRMRESGANAGLWILWPKKSSGVSSDLSEGVVRDAGLAAGLVDFKISAIDATWSGLRFATNLRPLTVAHDPNGRRGEQA